MDDRDVARAGFIAGLASLNDAIEELVSEQRKQPTVMAMREDGLWVVEPPRKTLTASPDRPRPLARFAFGDVVVLRKSDYRFVPCTFDAADGSRVTLTPTGAVPAPPLDRGEFVRLYPVNGRGAVVTVVVEQRDGGRIVLDTRLPGRK